MLFTSTPTFIINPSHKTIYAQQQHNSLTPIQANKPLIR